MWDRDFTRFDLPLEVGFIALIGIIGVTFIMTGQAAHRRSQLRPRTRRRVYRQLVALHIIDPAQAPEPTTFDALLLNSARAGSSVLVGSGLGFIIGAALLTLLLLALRNAPPIPSPAIFASIFVAITFVALFGSIAIARAHQTAAARRAGMLMERDTPRPISRYRSPVVLAIYVGLTLLYLAVSAALTLGLIPSDPLRTFHVFALDYSRYPWVIWTIPICMLLTLITVELALRLLVQQSAIRYSSDPALDLRAQNAQRRMGAFGLTYGPLMSGVVLSMQPPRTRVPALGVSSRTLASWARRRKRRKRRKRLVRSLQGLGSLFALQ